MATRAISRRRIIGMFGVAVATSAFAACAALPPAPVPTATELSRPTPVALPTPSVAVAPASGAVSKFVNNQGIRIHYEVEGKGPPLALVHGRGLSLEMWRTFGYTTALGKVYQLILVDIRGHGQSDKPSGPEPLRPDAMASDVVAVLDDVGVAKAHFLGYSMGGTIGWVVATTAPTRLLSLIPGGATPYGFHTEAEKAYFVTQLGAPPEIARWPGVADQLAHLTLPSLLFVGDNDPNRDDLAEAVKIMPNAAFVSFPGLDHLHVIQKSDLILPHVTKLLAGVKI
jgi:pimeloyl-ACP methyl ester carboxylesterase